MSRPTLDELGLKYHTDKASYAHDFCSIYDATFGAMRDEPITLLEIGVADGASIRMWLEYFPNAKVIGLDLEPGDNDTAYKKHAPHPEHPRFTLYLGDQTDRDVLRTVGKCEAPIDIVIDDGCHTMEAQQTSLGVLFQFVKPGGLYVVEDLHTSFVKRVRCCFVGSTGRRASPETDLDYPTGSDYGAATSYELLTQIRDLANIGGAVPYPKSDFIAPEGSVTRPSESMKYITAETADVHIYHTHETVEEDNLDHITGVMLKRGEA